MTSYLNSEGLEQGARCARQDMTKKNRRFHLHRFESECDGRVLSRLEVCVLGPLLRVLVIYVPHSSPHRKTRLVMGKELIIRLNLKYFFDVCDVSDCYPYLMSVDNNDTLIISKMRKKLKDEVNIFVNFTVLFIHCATSEVCMQ